MEKYNTLENKKDYEAFISNIPSYMEKLAKIIGKEKLNFDEEEIVKISEYFIDVFNNKSFTIEYKKEFIAYIGEAFMQRYGGEWGFTGEKDSFSPNEPAIGRYEPGTIRFCPINSIVRIFEKRNAAQYIEEMKYRDEMLKKTEAIFAKHFPQKNKRKK